MVVRVLEYVNTRELLAFLALIGLLAVAMYFVLGALNIAEIPLTVIVAFVIGFLAAMLFRTTIPSLISAFDREPLMAILGVGAILGIIGFVSGALAIFAQPMSALGTLKITTDLVSQALGNALNTAIGMLLNGLGLGFGIYIGSKVRTR